jgi:hypothetical protein
MEPAQLRRHGGQAMSVKGVCWTCGRARMTDADVHPRRPRCRECRTSRRKAATASGRSTRVQGTYGLREGEYEALRAAQGGKCAICGWLTGRRARVVDHDHGSGEVRGLLCNLCNRVIGFYRDRIRLFECFAEYLRNPPARKVLPSRDWSDYRGAIDDRSRGIRLDTPSDLR